MSMAIGFGPLAVYGGILLPNLIVLAVILVERRRGEGAHRVYRWGLPLSVAAEAGVLLASLTAAGEVLNAALARLGALLEPLYLNLGTKVVHNPARSPLAPS